MVQALVLAVLGQCRISQAADEPSSNNKTWTALRVINMEKTPVAVLNRRLSDEYSQRSSDNDVEDIPPDVAAFRDRQLYGDLSPTHATGHTTPGHVVGRPIHDSPEHTHHELPDVPTARAVPPVPLQDPALKVHSSSLLSLICLNPIRLSSVFRTLGRRASEQC